MAMTTKNFGQQGRTAEANTKDIYIGNTTVDTVEGDADNSGDSSGPATQSPSWGVQPKGPVAVATFDGGESNPNTVVANKDL
jgi:hypothetical protein